jgi:hypothetical protein
MRKLLVGCLAVAVVIILAAWLGPTQVLLGWLKGESFFQSRPSSAWRDALRDEDPAIQERARKQLVEGGDKSVAVLTELLRDSEGPDWAAAETRWTAAEILGEIGPAASDATPVLIAALADEDPHVRSVSAASLPAVDGPPEQAVPALIELFRKEPSVVAARALSEYGPDAEAAVPELTAILLDKDLDTELRWNAARTLGKIRGRAAAAIPVLVESLEDEAATVREHSAEALGDIGPPAKASVPNLIQVLDDPATRVRRDAARSLGQIGPAAKSAVPELKKLLQDSEPIVRDAAKTAVRTLAPDEPVSDDPPAAKDDTAGKRPSQ